MSEDDEPNHAREEYAQVPGPAEEYEEMPADEAVEPIPGEEVAARDALPEEAAEEEGPPEGSILQPCSGCGGLLDVSDHEPFAQVHCPMCGTLMRVRTQLKNFALTEVLGAGGMGAVYKARDLNLSRMVALKVVRREYSADAEYLGKFEREARITASVNHPHVVKVFSFGSDHGLFYIAMELVDKGSLDDLMSLQGRVAEVQVLEVGIQIAQGLQAAHLNGLIHRDVKPGNILFASANVAKIVDFGLALLAEHEAEERGEVWGTPYYVAPEKLNQEPEDFRSDIYSLGGTLFHAVAGRPPFEAETASLVALKHIKSKAVSLQAFAPDVSSATAFVINRMLNKDPEQRYQSYDELVEHLQYARAQLLEAANKPRQKKERVVVEGAQQQSFMGIVTLALIALLIAGGALLYVFRDRLFKNKQEAALAESQNSTTVRYQAARKQLMDGDYQTAEDVFGTLADLPDVAKPLQGWILVHEGFAAFLGGRITPGQTDFKALGHLDLTADDSLKPLATFFTALSRLAADPRATAPAATADFDKTSYGAIAPFILAIKDWELGSFDEAGVLLAQFLATQPAGDVAWIADYRPLAQKYATDLEAFQKLKEQIRVARTPETRAAALTALAQLKAQARGKLAEVLDAMEKTYQKKFSELDAEEETRAAQIRGRDTKALGEARVKFSALCAAYQFPEAVDAVRGLVVEDPKLAVYGEALKKKAEWLKEFQTQLLADVNKTGYPDPLVKKNGTTIAGGVTAASTKQIQIKTPYGFIPVAWTDLPPATILKMAQYFAQHEISPPLAADRNWLNGVFAFSFGMGREGRTMIVDAAQAKPEYADQLALFIEGTTAPAGNAPPSTGSIPAPAGNVPAPTGSVPPSTDSVPPATEEAQ